MELIEFLDFNGIRPSELTELGEGDRGIAYSYIEEFSGIMKVVKQTTSKTEYICAKLQKQDKFNNFAQIYDVEHNDKYYFILQEYVEKIGAKVGKYSIYSNYSDLTTKARIVQGINNPMDLQRLDFSLYEGKYGFYEPENVRSLYGYLDVIIDRMFEIGADDLHADNIGWVDANKIVLFDVDKINAAY